MPDSFCVLCNKNSAECLCGVKERIQLQSNPPSLRDQFAMAALTGLISHSGGSFSGTLEEFAKSAYQISDGMLAERDK